MSRETKPLPTLISSKELVLNRIEALERIRDQAITDLSDTTKDALGLWNAALTVRTMEAGIQELRIFMTMCGL